MNEPRAFGQVLNIGSSEEVSIAELAERVRRITVSRSPIVLIPYHERWDEQFEDMMRRVPDLSRVRELIGFEPQNSLDRIIGRLVQFERRSHTERL